MHLPTNTLLQGGKYKIVRFINAGGFGNTYEGLDVNLNKRVAIKEFFVKDFCSRDSETTLVTVTAPSKAPLIEYLKRKFMDEARAIANMEHENIVKVQALFEENGTAYYVMDYIDGESVGDLLKRRGSLLESEALPIIRKVASALDYMHKQNRLHLDVKPGNIMLRKKDGKVVLIDFGSSKQYAEAGGENTTTLAPCYTKGYAPSEQMTPEHVKFTAATDVYALGATLYKMLTGLTPPSAIGLMNGDEALSPLPNEVSQQVKTCVQKAMKPQRNMRLQSIEEFTNCLHNGHSRNKKWLWGIAVVIVSLVVILCVSMPKPRKVDGGGGGNSNHDTIIDTIDSVITPPDTIIDTIIDKHTYENKRVKKFIREQIFNHEFKYYLDDWWIEEHSSGRLREALLEKDPEMGELYLGCYLAGWIPAEDVTPSVFDIEYRDGYYYTTVVDDNAGIRRVLKYQAHLEGEKVVLTYCSWEESSEKDDFHGDITK